MKEILRENGDQTSSPDAKSTQRVGPLVAQSHRTLSPTPSSSLSTSSPLSQRRTATGTDSATPSLTADEDESDKLSYSNHRGVPAGKDEGALCEFDDVPPPDASGARPPLCSLSVFRASDMLAFEDYLHRSRRLPTRLGLPELLPSPERWHDWSWGQLREPVYVVEKRPEEMQVSVGASPPPSSHEGIGDDTLRPDAHDLPNLLGILS